MSDFANGLQSLSGLLVLTPEQSDFLHDAAAEVSRLCAEVEKWQSENARNAAHVVDLEAECDRYHQRLQGVDTPAQGAQEPTAVMVDAALNAWFKSPPSETDQGLERSMKAALMAALSLVSAEGSLIRTIEAEARRYAEMYPQSSDGRNTFVIFADWVARFAASPLSESAEVVQLREAMDLLHQARLSSISHATDKVALRNALVIARDAIWSGGDTVRAIAAIDAALAQPLGLAQPEAPSIPEGSR